jgi:hypothetical protein
VDDPLVRGRYGLQIGSVPRVCHRIENIHVLVKQTHKVGEATGVAHGREHRRCAHRGLQ